MHSRGDSNRVNDDQIHSCRLYKVLSMISSHRARCAFDCCASRGHYGRVFRVTETLSAGPLMRFKVAKKVVLDDIDTSICCELPNGFDNVIQIIRIMDPYSPSRLIRLEWSALSPYLNQGE